MQSIQRLSSLCPGAGDPCSLPGTLQGMEIRQLLDSCLGRCLESFQQVVSESTKIKERPHTSPGESAHPCLGTATKWCSDWPWQWPWAPLGCVSRLCLLSPSLAKFKSQESTTHPPICTLPAAAPLGLGAKQSIVNNSEQSQTLLPQVCPCGG